jgi:hypothetical protein
VRETRRLAVLSSLVASGAHQFDMRETQQAGESASEGRLARATGADYNHARHIGSHFA